MVLLGSSVAENLVRPENALGMLMSAVPAPVCLIVLAAGLSTRMGARDKLRLSLGEKTVLERSVLSALRAGASEVLVVTGPHDYTAVLEPYHVRIVPNPDYEEGMASSIRVGVESVDPAASAYGILLGDMPYIRSETIRALLQHVDARTIVVPHYEKKAGHPVLFAGCYRRELLALHGDVGARSVIWRHAEHVVPVEMGDPGILRDIDTAEAYRRAK